MIVDFHTHAFNDALAEKAIGKLAKVSGMPPQSDGTVSDLQKKMRAQSVDTAVVLNIATTAHSMHKGNDLTSAYRRCSYRPSIALEGHPVDLRCTR